LLCHVGLRRATSWSSAWSAGSNQPAAMSITRSPVQFSVGTICMRVLLVEPTSLTLPAYPRLSQRTVYPQG
jgi:hypothetical protein